MASQVVIEEQLKLLLRLQEIDSEILNLTSQKKTKPQEVEALKSELEAEKKASFKAEEKFKALQVKKKEKEIDLESKETNVKKLEMQLYQVKSNKDYTAMKKEIEGVKADNSLLEEEILKLLDELDSAKRDVDKEKASFAEKDKAFAERKQAVEVELHDIEERLAQAVSKRNELAPQVDKSILARYERILKNRGATAIVPAKDDSCGGCYMNLPPQVINEVALKDKIVVCESCSRILYIEDVQA